MDDAAKFAVPRAIDGVESVAGTIGVGAGVFRPEAGVLGDGTGVEAGVATAGVAGEGAGVEAGVATAGVDRAASVTPVDFTGAAVTGAAVPSACRSFSCSSSITASARRSRSAELSATGGVSEPEFGPVAVAGCCAAAGPKTRTVEKQSAISENAGRFRFIVFLVG